MSLIELLTSFHGNILFDDSKNNVILKEKNDKEVKKVESKILKLFELILSNYELKEPSVIKILLKFLFSFSPNIEFVVNILKNCIEIPGEVKKYFKNNNYFFKNQKIKMKLCNTESCKLGIRNIFNLLYKNFSFYSNYP